MWGEGGKKKGRKKAASQVLANTRELRLAEKLQLQSQLHARLVQQAHLYLKSRQKKQAALINMLHVHLAL